MDPWKGKAVPRGERLALWSWGTKEQDTGDYRFHKTKGERGEQADVD